VYFLKSVIKMVVKRKIKRGEKVSVPLCGSVQEAKVVEKTGEECVIVEIKGESGPHLFEVPMKEVKKEQRFNIGDHVVVQKHGGTVLVSAGSKGVILAGGYNTDDDLTVTFSVVRSPDAVEFDEAVTVTQNRVPWDSVEFLRPASEDEGECEFDSESAEDEKAGEGSNTRVCVLRRLLSLEVFEDALEVLSMSELESLVELLEESPGLKFKDVREVITALQIHRLPE